MTSPGDPQRPDGDSHPAPERGYPVPPAGATPYDGPAVPPYVYNPYGNVSYPATYPTSPAGLGPDDAPPPARRPGAVLLALVLLVVSTLPYLLIGFLASAAAGEIVAAVPPEQLAQFRQLGVDVEQVVRVTGVLLLGVALLYALLAVLAFTGRRWARGLLAAMTVGFVLMASASIAAVAAQGVAVDGGSLVVGFLPIVLAVVGVVLLFGSAARAWFARR